MKKIFIKASILFLLSGLICFSLPSCTKTTDSTTTITVLDTLGALVSGATVHIYPKSLKAGETVLAGQDQTQVTSGGKATFVFKHEAILNIEASLGALHNTGDVVKLEPGDKVVEKAVTIKN